EACRAFDVPVIRGNVSMYNQSPGNAIYPTPLIGIVGLFEELSHITPNVFQTAGDVVYVVEKPEADLGGSELQYLQYGKHEGHAPTIDLQVEKERQIMIKQAIHSGIIQSSEDLAEGGLAVALAESAMKAKGLGVDITLQHETATALFTETQSRYLVTVKAEDTEEFE